MSHTIAAISTGNQVSAIGIIRMTGDQCGQIAEQVFTLSSQKSLTTASDRTMVLGSLHDRQGRTIDRCIAVYTRGPRTYTGEDTVEFHCHGSPIVLAAALEALYAAGAKPAQRGEFTKRAFLNGKLDLVQAEAVIDLIEAETADAAANAAGQIGGKLREKLTPIYNDLTDLCSHFHAVLDYPDEDIDDFSLADYADTLRTHKETLYKLMQSFSQGKVLKHGISAAIVGRPNVGKSSLLNALVGYDRVIVTEIAGTTRDTVEESVVIGKTRVRLIDTAGIRQTDDRIEAMGTARSLEAVRTADLVLMVLDGSQALTDDDRDVMDRCKKLDNVIVLVNKSDKTQVLPVETLPFETVISVCAKDGTGLDALSQAIDERFAGSTPCDGSILTNPRQYEAVFSAHGAICSALCGLEQRQTPDMVLLDVEAAMEAMGEVTGATVREDITARIFERFCVGK